MNAPLTTPSPHLRDALRGVVENLRAEAEQVERRHAEAAAEVARLRAELAHAEIVAQERAQERDTLTGSIRWAQRQAEEFTAELEARPDVRLAEVGLMVEPPRPAADVVSHDMPFNVVQAPADVVAALTGGHPVVADTVVATSGPTVTQPDRGAAHPVPNPPSDSGDQPRHAKAKGSRWTGGFKTLRGHGEESSQ